MVIAFVFIQARKDLIPETGERLAELPGVAEVYSVTGPWDLIAVLRLKDLEALDEVVTRGIHALAGVEKTETHLAFRTYPRKLLDQGFSLGAAP
ncbi:MAG: AsnC family transcriptional regulator [Thermus sp.]|uniref:Lrp/AsnC family transcriptional regulator n=1 Tax=Thermus sp. TaxID=275 RepID=UPI0033182696